MTTPFELSVTVTDARIVVRSGMYLSPVQTWERVCGLTAVELLARWDDVMGWIPPEEREGREFLACQEELDPWRLEFIGLPHAAQAAVVAEWEGDPWPGAPTRIGAAVRDEVRALIERAEEAERNGAA